jgi:hypothetical protein
VDRGNFWLEIGIDARVLKVRKVGHKDHQNVVSLCERLLGYSRIGDFCDSERLALVSVYRVYAAKSDSEGNTACKTAVSDIFNQAIEPLCPT